MYFLLQPLPPWLFSSYGVLECCFLDFVRGSFRGRKKCAREVICGGVKIEIAALANLSFGVLTSYLVSPEKGIHSRRPMVQGR